MKSLKRNLVSAILLFLFASQPLLACPQEEAPKPSTLQSLASRLLSPSSSTNLCGSNCSANDDLLQLVQRFEGFSPFIYKDVAGYDTIGFGHLVRKGETFNQPITGEQAMELLRKDMRPFEKHVNGVVVRDLQQNQFNALTSITYNLGQGAMSSKAILMKTVNAKKDPDVPEKFLLYSKARVNGQLKVVRGLLVRRQAEANVYSAQ